MTTEIDFLPAGTYYIGDLCYVLSAEQWTEVCDNTDEGCYSLNDGTKIALFKTPYGDGEYETSSGIPIMVDSGTIGCVEISDIDINRIPHNGSIVLIIDSLFTPLVGDMYLRFGTVEVYFEFNYEEDYIDE